MTRLTASQLEAILTFIDARMDELFARNSCGPHVVQLHEKANQARGRLHKELVG